MRFWVLFYILVIISMVNILKKTELKENINTRIDYYTRELFSFGARQIVDTTLNEREMK